MAYTKSPTQDTHNVVRIPIGGENFLVSDGTSVPSGATGPDTTLNFIDCFPLPERQGPDSPPKYRVSKRVGWKSVTASGSTAVTGGNLGQVIVASSAAQTVHFAIGNVFYTMDVSSGPPYTVTAIVTGTGSYIMGMTNAVDASNVRKIATIDNAGQLYVWNEDGTGLTTTNLAALSLSANRNIVFLNGYLFAATGNAVYNSGAANALTTWTSTNFIAAEMWPDEISWLDKHKNYLVVFGNYSTEFFYDGGIEVGSPLARQEAYASKVGLVGNSRNKKTALIGDDIYFVGRTQTDSWSLYRVSDFRIEKVSNQYFDGFLNTQPGTTSSVTYYSLDTYLINNNPMIGITFQTTADGVAYYYTTFLYNPETKVFSQMSTAGTYATANSDLPSPNLMLGSPIMWDYTYNNRSRIYGVAVTSGTQLYHWLEEVGTKTISVSSTVYTDILDLGTNRWKHIARVDAIGDFDSDTLTLSYNGTPNYGQAYTACTPTYNAATIGYGNNISWYNLGGFRRMSFKLTVAGYGTSFLEGFDVEYNVGSA